MEIRKKKFHNGSIVTITERLDTTNSNQLQAYLDELLKSGVLNLIIDFSDLDYISSSGLRIILVTAKRLKAARGEFRLCGMKKFIKEIFDISGFSKILKIDDDLETSISKID